MSEDQVTKLLKRLDTAWAAFQESYAGVPDAQLLESGVMGDWSVRDILAHVTIWEEEALTHLPLIIAGGRPPRYVTYGGIDAFNAHMIEQKNGLSLSDVRRQLDDTHRRLITFIQRAPADQFTRETRPSSPQARYVQPLPVACPSDTGLAEGAVSRVRWGYTGGR